MQAVGLARGGGGWGDRVGLKGSASKTIKKGNSPVAFPSRVARPELSKAVGIEQRKHRTNRK